MYIKASNNSKYVNDNTYDQGNDGDAWTNIMNHIMTQDYTGSMRIYFEIANTGGGGHTVKGQIMNALTGTLQQTASGTYVGFSQDFTNISLHKGDVIGLYTGSNGSNYSVGGRYFRIFFDIVSAGILAMF